MKKRAQKVPQLILGPADFKYVTTIDRFDIFNKKGPMSGISSITKTIKPASFEEGFSVDELTIKKYQELYTEDYSWYNDFINIFNTVNRIKPATSRIVAISINYDFFRGEEMYIFSVLPKGKSFTNSYVALWGVRYKNVL